MYAITPARNFSLCYLGASLSDPLASEVRLHCHIHSHRGFYTISEQFEHTGIACFGEDAHTSLQLARHSPRMCVWTLCSQAHASTVTPQARKLQRSRQACDPLAPGVPFNATCTYTAASILFVSMPSTLVSLAQARMRAQAYNPHGIRNACVMSLSSPKSGSRC